MGSWVRPWTGCVDGFVGTGVGSSPEGRRTPIRPAGTTRRPAPLPRGGDAQKTGARPTPKLLPAKSRVAAGRVGKSTGSWAAEELLRGRWVVGAWVCRAVRGGVRPSRRRAAGVRGTGAPPGAGRRAPPGAAGRYGPIKGRRKGWRGWAGAVRAGRWEDRRGGEGRAVGGSQERRGPGGGRISP